MKIQKKRSFPQIKQILNNTSNIYSKEYDMFDYIEFLQTGKLYNREYKVGDFQDKARGLKMRHERKINRFKDLRLKKNLLTDKRINKKRKQIKNIWRSIKDNFDKGDE